MGWEAVEGKELRQAAEYTSKNLGVPGSTKLGVVGPVLNDPVVTEIWH